MARLTPETETAVDQANPKDLLGVKKAPLRLVPPALMILAAPAMALGAKKYGPYNWRVKKVLLSVYMEAILRHLFAIVDGEDFDPESGALHWSHIAACVGIVADALYGGNLIDDRPPAGPAPGMLDELDAGKKTDSVQPEPPQPHRPVHETLPPLEERLAEHDRERKAGRKHQLALTLEEYMMLAMRNRAISAPEGGFDL